MPKKPVGENFTEQPLHFWPQSLYSRENYKIPSENRVGTKIVTSNG